MPKRHEEIQQQINDFLNTNSECRVLGVQLSLEEIPFFEKENPEIAITRKVRRSHKNENGLYDCAVIKRHK